MLHTPEQIRQRVDYCPETGVFVWREREVLEKSLRTDRSWNSRYAGKPAGTLSKSLGYVIISLDKQMYLAHRLAWAYMTGEWPTDEIDHINRARADNRFANLRAATAQENRRNKSRAQSRTGVVGVRKNGTGFQAVIGHEYKTVVVGQFRTIEDARLAREAAARKLHGDFARIE